MTPADLRERRKALLLTQAQLGALLWDKPESGRATIAGLEGGSVKMTKRTAAWLDLELSKLEAERLATRSESRP